MEEYGGNARTNAEGHPSTSKISGRRDFPFRRKHREVRHPHARWDNCCDGHVHYWSYVTAGKCTEATRTRALREGRPGWDTNQFGLTGDGEANGGVELDPGTGYLTDNKCALSLPRSRLGLLRGGGQSGGSSRGLVCPTPAQQADY